MLLQILFYQAYEKQMNKIQKIILAMSMMLAGSALSDTRVGSWVLEEYIDDSIDSILLSIHRDSTDSTDRVPRLYINCHDFSSSQYRSHKNSTFLSLDFSGNLVLFNEITDVDMRIDKDKAQRILMYGDAYMLMLSERKGQAIKYIKSLFGGKKLYMRAYSRDSYVDAEFDITGIENAIKPIREACNW